MANKEEANHRAMRLAKFLPVVRAMFFMLAGWFVTGCDNHVPYEVKDPDRKAKSGAKQVPEKRAMEKDPQSRGGIYCVEYTDFPRVTLPAISEVSIVAHHTVIAAMKNLTPGKRYTAEWQCFDGAGKAVKIQGDTNFTSAESSHVLTCSTVEAELPNYRFYTPGNWRWVLRVPNHGEFNTEISVLPANQAEKDEQAQYEEVRESVLQVFAHYWLGLPDGTFHTIISFKPKDSAAAVDLKEQIARTKIREAELTATLIDLTNKAGHTFGSAGQPYGLEHLHAMTAFKNVAKERQQLEAQLARAIPATSQVSNDFQGYIQVVGMSTVGSGFFSSPVSEVDRLNGITYRGKAVFSFKAFRFLKDKGWTEWEQSGRWPRPATGSVESRLNLNFSITQRDKNWIITTEGGDEFVNGKLTRSGSQWLNERPTLKYTAALAKGTIGFTRQSYLEMGDSARNDPEAVDQAARQTMNLLRGRALK